MSYNVANSSFLVRPLEKHDFMAGNNDFYCRVCARPKAMHLHDGFMAGGKGHTVTMDTSVRYGKHPHWFRPGTIILNRAEQAQIDRIYSVKRPANDKTGKLDPECVTVAKPKVRRIGNTQIEI